MPPLHCVSSIAACHAPPALCANLQAARADNVAALRALPGVTVVLRDAELKRRHEASRQVADPNGKIAGCLRRLGSPIWRLLSDCS